MIDPMRQRLAGIFLRLTGSRHNAMQIRHKPIVRNWWPVVAWMSVIFLFSTDLFSGSNTSSILRPLLSSLLPSLTVDEIDWIHVITRKLGHWCEYFILARLLIGALTGQFPMWKPRRHWLCAVVLAVLYSASDEWHQSFVPSRSPSSFDVLIDGLGAICGALWFARGKKNSD